MTIEQLNVLNAEFNQLEELKKYLRKYEENRMTICARVDWHTVDDEILNKIVRKYTKNVIEDLKKEIKKRETELENLSILQLNNLV